MAITVKKCEVCGNEFIGTAKAKCCSGKCRLRKHRQKKNPIHNSKTDNGIS
ncbi:hypothetical protein LPST10_00001 [Salmonella phage LPST10]|uniref:Uncharacterized protein n=1 Tax=Salmonella phage LPST10 TaxID=1973454 RepID=A0A1W6DXS0_9CAUD|nr:hypothetical protein KGB45_gp01 [Salmonella phage LPST10]ARK07733.1 hypothetical protein LPST10_00001 [Salmonella phage LPST10]